MDQPGDSLLTAPILTENQHRHVSFRQQSRLSAQLSHDRANPNKEALVADRFDIITRYIYLGGIASRREIALDGEF
jgi:hypothetical protein